MNERGSFAYQRMKVQLSVYGPIILKLALPVVIIAFIYVQGRQELSKVNLAETIVLLRRLNPLEDLLIGGTALAAVLVMTLYDFVLVRLLRIPVKVHDLIRISWISNTFTNFISIAGLTGAGMRLLLYRKYQVPTAELARLLVFLSVSVMSGLSVLAWLVLAGWLPGGALLADHRWLTLAIWGMAFYLPIFLLAQRIPAIARRLLSHERGLPVRATAAMVGTSLLEWVTAGVVFWLISHTLGSGMTLTQGIGVFAVAAIAGMISMAPGGLGAFDLTALIGLQIYGLEPSQSLAILLIFRIYYYIIPWIIGLLALAFHWVLSKEKWTLPVPVRNVWFKSLNGWQRAWSSPAASGTAADIGLWCLASLVFVGGAALLLSAATPGLFDRLRGLHYWITPNTMKWSQQAAIPVALLLIVLSKGIRLRLKLAYQWTLLLLAAGTVLAILKGFDYEEAIYLAAVGLLLWLSKFRFDRKHYVYERASLIGWLLATGIIASLYLLLRDAVNPLPFSDYPFYWQKKYVLPFEQVFRATAVGLGVTWLFITVWLGVKADKPPLPQPSEHEREKLREWLNPNPELQPLNQLDRHSLLWAAEGEIVIPYTYVKGMLVALCDPIGAPDKLHEGIAEFRRLADQYGLTPVFARVSSTLAPLYQECGFRLFRLGAPDSAEADRENAGGLNREERLARELYANASRKNGFGADGVHIAYPAGSPLLRLVSGLLRHPIYFRR